ncbi:MAG: EamA family transporter [Opitutales bacterium]
MSWITVTLVSAFFLGCYELCIKHSVHDNAVLPVLFFSNLCSAAIWGILLAVPHLAPGALPGAFLVTPLTLAQHSLLLLKSVIVSGAWICGYFALKHLPLSLASPVRATSPMWTLLGAVLFLAERPSWIEGLGIIVTLASFVGLSFAGRAEGIHFLRNKWFGYLAAGTVLNAVSGLYDKILLGRLGFSAATVQCWFSVYLAVLFLPLALGWKFRLWPRHEFHWRWSIPFVSLALLVADFLYFGALRHPDALVAIVSSLRRGSTLVAFAGSLLLFGEKHGSRKILPVLGILAGIVLTLLG